MVRLSFVLSFHCVPHLGIAACCSAIYGALNPSCWNLVVHLVGLLGGPKTLAVGSNMHW